MVSLYFVKFPLAERVRTFKRPIQAAFIGLGESAEAMLDGTLSRAQLPCYCRPKVKAPPICVNVFCPYEEALRYLEDRPGLKNFFSIRFSYGEWELSLEPMLKTSWGILIFQELKETSCFSRSFWNDNLSRKLNYAFVSLNNYDWNCAVVRIIAKVRKHAAIHVAKPTNLPMDVEELYETSCRNGNRSVPNFGVYSPRDNVKLPEYLVDAARRVDDLWMKIGAKCDVNRNARDLAAPENRFYRDASLGCVSSLPDVLLSMNPSWIFDYINGDNRKIADEYRKMLASDPIAEECMIMALHRRSDVQKLCRGWSPTNDVKKAAKNGSMKNMTTLEHVGITSSRLGSLLSKLDARKYFMDGKASNYEWSKLDWQDRMNVRFNRLYAREADVSPMDLPIIKENDRLVARNIPYILTGDDELFVPQTL